MQPTLQLPLHDQGWAEGFLAAQSLEAARLVGCAPGASFGSAKCWPGERFAEALRDLAEQEGLAAVLLFGSSAEASATRTVAQGLSGLPVIDLSGRTNLAQALALLVRLDLFLTNDSGLMHAAAALGVPTLAVFGSTNPVTTAPLGPWVELVRRPLECSPCLKPTCPRGDLACFMAIAPQEVTRAALGLLARRSGRESSAVKVLIVKLSALGDIVQSLPVAMAIWRQEPQVHLDWLVEAPSAGLLQGHPALNQVLVSPRRQSVHQLDRGGLKTWLRWLRAVEYDAVLDLQGLMKSAIFVSLSRGRRKIGFAGGKEPLAAWALNQRLPAFDPQRHALERYLDLLKPLGIMRPARLGVAWSPRRRPWMRRLACWVPAGPAAPGGTAPRGQVGFQVVAHGALGATGALLHQASNLAISGSPADQPVTQAILAQAGLPDGVTDLAGRTGLKDLAAALCLSTVVATDTGVMHLAAALSPRWPLCSALPVRGARGLMARGTKC
ncbi:heptosyltransferase II [Desulfarculales bacterium]